MVLGAPWLVAASLRLYHHPHVASPLCVCVSLPFKGLQSYCTRSHPDPVCLLRKELLLQRPYCQMRSHSELLAGHTTLGDVVQPRKGTVALLALPRSHARPTHRDRHCSGVAPWWERAGYQERVLSNERSCLRGDSRPCAGTFVALRLGEHLASSGWGPGCQAAPQRALGVNPVVYHVGLCVSLHTPGQVVYRRQGALTAGQAPRSQGFHGSLDLPSSPGRGVLFPSPFYRGNTDADR